MPSLKAIRNRIASVKNTQKITRAMKLVAAARLRRAQDSMTAARPYAKRLQEMIADVAARTRDSSITADELSGGTFTLSNTGSRGALFDTPIINQPQVAILATGAVVRRPVVVTDPAGAEGIAIRSMAYLALTYDHRLIDGAGAAHFLVTMKSRLEEGRFESDLGLAPT